MILSRVLVSILAAFAHVTARPNECQQKNKAVLFALLPLHSGEDCNVVVQRGVQQMAALQLARDEINRKNEMLPKLDVKVLDTCSSREEAVKGALQVALNAQLGCIGPFFLGLLGPDDKESLASVSRVISMFNFAHVIPFATQSFSSYNALDVETVDTAMRAKSIEVVLEEMNWHSFYLAFSTDTISTEIAANLLEHGNNCARKAVLPIPLDPSHITEAYNRLLEPLEKATQSRLLLIFDTAESAINLLQFIESVSHKTKTIVYVQSSGLLPNSLPTNISRNTMIMHQTSDSSLLPSTFQSHLTSLPLWKTHLNQTSCESCEDFVRDASTAPLVSAVHIFAEALKSAIASRCPGERNICSRLTALQSSQWKNMVESTVSAMKSDNGLIEHKLRFHEMSGNLVYLYAAEEDGLYQKIGEVRDDILQVNRSHLIGISNTSLIEQCAEDLMLPTTPAPYRPRERGPQITQGMPTDVNILGFELRLTKFGFYELVALLTSAALIFLIAFLLLLIWIYRCVKMDKDYFGSSSASVESMMITPLKKEKTVKSTASSKSQLPSKKRSR